MVEYLRTADLMGAVGAVRELPVQGAVRELPLQIRVRKIRGFFCLSGTTWLLGTLFNSHSLVPDP